ncbi:MAG TPA: helix-turn-helix transcriptional regulator [Candidatus Saccharimonadales bacterium]|nr:helix-turn-helix transcriptional regulator [Candidatus Saccharimonadales bacterium]
MDRSEEARQLKAFGRRLAEVRKTRGLTQQELAGKLDISLVSVGYLETGKRWPRLNTLHRVAAVLGVPIDDLFRGL